MYELKRLAEAEFVQMKEFFRNIFTRKPWNEDWSDDTQLTAYIQDIAGCFNSICCGFTRKRDGESDAAFFLPLKRKSKMTDHVSFFKEL